MIVFTDLDGTLLDHSSYDYAPALPTLDRLRRAGIPLVLASSKTAAEMVPLRRELGFETCPLICENGAGVVAPGETGDEIAGPYSDLRKALDKVDPPLRICFEGFGDMEPARISEVTGLPLDQALLAARRAFSEPGIWTGSDTERDAFLAQLSYQGITARHGGRFLTLSFGATKADQMAHITAEMSRSVTISLGDAPNDADMLRAADYAIVLPNAQGHPVEVAEDGGARVLRAALSGPAGWNAALGDLLTELGVTD
ncbi:HAD-IIB family hydrolase [Aestuariivita boseongensis]|uniref:HAD-IIB family hydrolase n=1 Tax=Aestuariivita boseongensis TaxID=1470562 RepID=UPI0009E2821D|nr:HAD-IIB family hydrolase [Aestuariivita boseongensis]